MISIEEIDRTISELEGRDTSFANCEKLAWLYIVRDHVQPSQENQAQPTSSGGGSDFLEAVNGKDSVRVWTIMDELMTTMHTLQPRIYTAVLQRLAAI